MSNCGVTNESRSSEYWSLINNSYKNFMMSSFYFYPNVLYAITLKSIFIIQQLKWLFTKSSTPPRLSFLSHWKILKLGIDFIILWSVLFSFNHISHKHIISEYFSKIRADTHQNQQKTVDMTNFKFSVWIYFIHN